MDVVKSVVRGGADIVESKMTDVRKSQMKEKNKDNSRLKKASKLFFSQFLESLGDAGQLPLARFPDKLKVSHVSGNHSQMLTS